MAACAPVFVRSRDALMPDRNSVRAAQALRCLKDGGGPDAPPVGRRAVKRPRDDGNGEVFHGKKIVLDKEFGQGTGIHNYEAAVALSSMEPPKVEFTHSVQVLCAAAHALRPVLTSRRSRTVSSTSQAHRMKPSASFTRRL